MTIWFGAGGAYRSAGQRQRERLALRRYFAKLARMQAWHDLYEMLGGAAATLLGLLFVSMSLNAEIILGPGHTHSRRLAEQAFQNYICVLVISLLALFPAMSTSSFGQSILWVTLFWGLWVLYRMYQVMTAPPSQESRVRSLRRFLSSFAGFGCLIFAGISMMLGNVETLTAAIGVMLLLISATVVSWELLINVAAQRYAARKD
jgi:Ca2+/Na+ antiporter